MTGMTLTVRPAITETVASLPRAGIEAAFDVYARGLYRFFAVRTGDPHVADDLMQQLWLQAVEGRPPDALEEIGYWLLGIARNVLVTHWRRHRVRSERLPKADPALAAELAERMTREPLPLEEMQRRETRDQLLLAVTSLIGPEQDLIVGHYFEDRSFGELAASLGITERAVEGRLYRARQSLREMLRDLK